MNRNNTRNKTISMRVKILICVLIGALVIALLFGIKNYITFLNYKRDVAAIKVQHVSMDTIADGEYFGDCSVDLIRARVRVVVQDHLITELELLEHYHDRGVDAEVILEQILAQQKIDVEAISGATNSSNVIQEAIYHALTNKRTIRNK